MVEAPAAYGMERPKEIRMAETVYKVIELIGTSNESWERAAKVAVERAAVSLSSPLTKSGSADSLRLCSLRQGDRRWRWGGLRGFRAT